MKNVLVLLHDDVGQEARFQAAIDLTRILDGHLTCIDVVVMPPFVSDYADVGASARLIAAEQEREDANRMRMQARLKAEGVSFSWFDQCGFLSPIVRESAAMADVIVLNRELDDIKYPDMLEVVGEVAVMTGKPILAVPATAGGLDAVGSALVAWDGSKESEAALRAAVPLLSNAGSVTILEIDDGSLKQPVGEATAYLSRHGIHATVRHEKSMIDRPSTIILDTIDAIGAAYLVMGGFGHSRFVEAVFGGVTRRMLKECPVPIFLAH